MIDISNTICYLENLNKGERLTLIQRALVVDGLGTLGGKVRDEVPVEKSLVYIHSSTEQKDTGRIKYIVLQEV